MAPAEDLPEYAYVPGQTPRHPEDRFDAVRATAQPGATEDDLATCAAFRAGLRFLEAGYFWEAHEVLEPVWMALPPGSEAQKLVQALIQLANARLKRVMGRPKATRRLCAIVRGLLSEIDANRVMGLCPEALMAQVDSLERELDSAI